MAEKMVHTSGRDGGIAQALFFVIFGNNIAFQFQMSIVGKTIAVHNSQYCLPNLSSNKVVFASTFVFDNVPIFHVNNTVINTDCCSSSLGN